MDTTPIVARLSAIANAVNALKNLQSLSYDEFAREHVLNASAERDFQVAIQAAIDIGSILLAGTSAKVPESYRDIFLALADVDILPRAFAARLAQMAQFRNVLVHLYLEVDLQKVYQYLQHNLADFELFAQHVSAYLNQIKTSD